MKINCFGVEFNFTDPIIKIGIISFDVRKAEEFVKENKLTAEGELARLYLNVLGWDKVVDSEGMVLINKRIGIDLSTASYDDILDFLNTTDEKMSESIKQLMRKSMKLKDNNKFSNEINLVSKKLKKEYELIDLESQSIDTLGTCGGGRLGKVRLDGSTMKPRRFITNL